MTTTDLRATCYHLAEFDDYGAQPIGSVMGIDSLPEFARAVVAADPGMGEWVTDIPDAPGLKLRVVADAR